ncbi:MAG TPA: hypothetical protein V6D47_06605 [Oscillatoriaceae cyanobacterium]
MNRAAALALSLICLPLVLEPLAQPGWADVPESAASKQKRIAEYQDHRLIYDPGSKGQGYTLRQGPDTIYDVDFVELMNDPSLTRFWLGERNRDYAIWIGTGVVGVPLGAVLFYQNFLGSGTFAPFTSPTQASKENASDWRTFTLSLVGVAIASYGLYNLGRWALEELDIAHPERLDSDSIAPRVKTFNDDLRARLNLDASDIPPPPTPRPSVTPSGSPSPGVPLITPSGLQPSAPQYLLPTYPEGGPPAAVPTPLPVETPSLIQEGAPSPTPKPRPTFFDFPGAEPLATPPPEATP